MENKKELECITMLKVKSGMVFGEMEKELTGFLKKNSRNIKKTICNINNEVTKYKN